MHLLIFIHKQQSKLIIRDEYNIKKIYVIISVILFIRTIDNLNFTHYNKNFQNVWSKNV